MDRNEPYYTGRITPTPKQVRYGKDDILIAGARGARVCAVVSTKATPQQTAALAALAERVRHLSGQCLPLTRTPERFDVIISIGDTRHARQLQVRPPRQREGYVIRTVKRGKNTVIVCKRPIVVRQL